MSIFWKTAMLVFLLASLAGLVWAMCHEEKSPRFMQAVCFGGMGLGFLLGMTGKVLDDPRSCGFMLYMFGAYLCYNGVIFSFPRRREEKEKVHE